MFQALVFVADISWYRLSSQNPGFDCEMFSLWMCSWGKTKMANWTHLNCVPSSLTRQSDFFHSYQRFFPQTIDAVKQGNHTELCWMAPFCVVSPSKKVTVPNIEIAPIICSSRNLISLFFTFLLIFWFWLVYHLYLGSNNLQEHQSKCLLKVCSVQTQDVQRNSLSRTWDSLEIWMFLADNTLWILSRINCL